MSGRVDENPWAPTGGRTPAASKSSGTAAPSKASDNPFLRPGGPGDDSTSAMAMEKKTPQAVDHLREAAALTAETEKTTYDTLGELERQGEQMARIQRKLDTVEDNVDHSGTILKGMKSFFGNFFGTFAAKPKVPEEVLKKREAERAAKRSGGASTPATSGGVGAPGDARAATGQLYKSKDPKFAEEDELLEAISKNVAGMQQAGNAMRDELEKQDVVLDGVVASVDRTDGKIKKADKDARVLARS